MYSSLTLQFRNSGFRIGGEKKRKTKNITQHHLNFVSSPGTQQCLSLTEAECSTLVWSTFCTFLSKLFPKQGLISSISLMFIGQVPLSLSDVVWPHYTCPGDTEYGSNPTEQFIILLVLLGIPHLHCCCKFLALHITLCERCGEKISNWILLIVVQKYKGSSF